MRSFLTRFPNSRIGVVLLVPCLLVCLACATPFPIESLEQGMTYETVREKFGEPEAIRIAISCSRSPCKPEGVESSWTYVHEEQNYAFTAYCAVFSPMCVVMPPFPLVV